MPLTRDEDLIRHLLMVELLCRRSHLIIMKTLLTKTRLSSAILAALVAVLLAVTGCKGNDSYKGNADSIVGSMVKDGYARMPQQGFELICIQDMPMQQNKEIFKGTNDALPDSIFPLDKAENSVNVFLVANEMNYILFDAGLGEEKGGTLREKLSKLHVHPEDITAVIITHFHPHHIGGMVFNDDPAFPNADVYANVAEYNGWVNSTQQSHSQQVLEMLACYANRLHLFQDGDTLIDAKGDGSLPIVAHNAAGHTLGHTVFEVGDVLITGDLIHTRHLQHPDPNSHYDLDSTLSDTARKYWLQYARDHNKILAGMHLPLPGVLDYQQSEE